MHYCCYLITQDCPTDKKIEEILKPFEESNSFTEHCVEWDWYEVGGRYGGLLDLAIDLGGNDKYRYCYLESKCRVGRLYRSNLLEAIRDNTQFNILFDECKWWRYMGIRNGYIHVDGGFLSELKNFDELASPDHGFCYITEDGKEGARSAWSIENRESITDEEFDQKKENVMREALKKNMFLTIIDMHD